MKNFLLNGIMLLCGAIIMTLELVGSRVLAPYVGTSIFVWTSLIGIMLASLSLGYWLGGLIADKKLDLKILSAMIFSPGLFICFVALGKDFFLYWLMEFNLNIPCNSFIATLILFSAPSIFLGMISPYIIKFKINDIKTSGATVGSLYALSTIGSILGTFLTGFFLIPHFRITHILLFISILLIFISVLIFPKKIFSAKIVLGICSILLGALIKMESLIIPHDLDLIDVETLYNRVWIYNSFGPNGNLVKFMRLNNEGNSASFLLKDGLVFNYLKYFRLAEYFKPNFDRTLMLGGAGYSYPQNYLKRFKSAKIDVVEMDPALTQLAKEHFGLKEDKRMKIYHQDARIFLNNSKDKYDVVLGDAFNSLSTLPYQLTTTEAVKKMHDLLSADGVALINMISAIEGEQGEFLRAEYATYKSIFPQVYIFTVDKSQKSHDVQNIMLAALKSKKIPSFSSKDKEIDRYLQSLWTEKISNDMPLLTDDYAPVEYYMGKVFIPR